MPNNVNMIANKVSPINRPTNPNAINPPKNDESRQRHRPGDAKTDQPRLGEIVNGVDEYGPEDHEHSPGLPILRKQPPPRPTPDQEQKRSTDLADRQQRPNKAEHGCARHAGDRRTDNELDRLTALPMPRRLPPYVSPVRRSSAKFGMGQKALRNSVDSATAGVFCAAQQARSTFVCPLI
jgi:hypothetical protein